MQTCFPYFYTHYYEAVWFAVWYVRTRMYGGQAIDILIVFFKHQKLDFDQDHHIVVIAAAISKKFICTYYCGLMVVGWWPRKQRKRRTVFSCSGPHMYMRLLSVFAILSRLRMEVVINFDIHNMHTRTAHIFSQILELWRRNCNFKTNHYNYIHIDYTKNIILKCMFKKNIMFEWEYLSDAGNNGHNSAQ